MHNNVSLYLSVLGYIYSIYNLQTNGVCVCVINVLMDCVESLMTRVVVFVTYMYWLSLAVIHTASCWNIWRLRWSAAAVATQHYGLPWWRRRLCMNQQSNLRLPKAMVSINLCAGYDFTAGASKHSNTCVWPYCQKHDTRLQDENRQPDILVLGKSLYNAQNGVSVNCMQIPYGVWRYCILSYAYIPRAIEVALACIL